MNIKQYPSGLRLVVNTKTDLDIVSFRIFIKVGAIDEEVNEYGIAHFLEHMFFKSTKEHSWQELAELFDDYGTKKNAFTGMHSTCYYFKSLKSMFEPSLKLFAEMLQNNTYNPKELNNEKKVILEEYKMGNDDTQKKCILNAFSSLFHGTCLEHDVIGTPKHIKSFTPQMLTDFKQKHYKPHKMIISVSGNITLREVEKYLKKHLKTLFDGDYKGSYELDKVISVTPKQNYVVKSKDNEQSTVYILTDLGNKTNLQMYPYDLLFAILGYGMSSKLYSVVRGEKGLVYSIHASTTSMGANNFAEIMFATSNEKVCNALKTVLKILKDCASGNINTQELEKAKNKYIAGMVYSKETNGGISMRNGSDLLAENRIESFEQIEKDIRAVTLEQVVASAKDFYAQTNYVVSCIGKCTRTQVMCYKH